MGLWTEEAGGGGGGDGVRFPGGGTGGTCAPTKEASSQNAWFIIDGLNSINLSRAGYRAAYHLPRAGQKFKRFLGGKKGKTLRGPTIWAWQEGRT